jgi:drug/metabolite transporter (DMT)-like permease
MPLRGVILVLTCVALLAAGQLLFKFSATQWRVDGVSWSTLRSLFSPVFVLALAIYGVATILWVFALRTMPLTVAFPLYALTFVIVPLLAHWFVGEPLKPGMLIGGAIIVAGVLVAVR